RFGLPCWGTLQLVIEPLFAHSRLADLLARLSAHQTVRRSVRLADGAVTLEPAAADAEPRLDGAGFASVLGPRHRLLVVGAGQLSRYLCEMAIALDFDVTVSDPRQEYRAGWQVEGVALTTAMPDDMVIAARPDARTAVIALTHDPKLDDLALIDALQTPAFYVGALGSRANHARRVARLREHFGLTPAQLARLRGPAGIYIGSRTPPEIALSIMAEIVAGKNGAPLPPAASVAAGKARQPGGAGVIQAGLCATL
ncbi:XdhC family protein, partial [Bordetella bronchiseptica]|uniref:XdhC family protein n=1 Tax=Bordetella bronchiseptica TaxID=518 RepID=UPI003EDBC9CA